MAEYDGSVKINTEILTKSAQAQLRSLENRIHKTSDKIKGLNDKMDALKDAKVPTDLFTQILNDLRSSQDALDKVNARMEKFVALGGDKKSDAFQRMQYDANQYRIELAAIQEERKKLIANGEAFTIGSETDEFAKLSQQLEAAEGDMNVLTMRYMDFADKAKAVEQRMEATAQKEAEAAAEAERLKEIGENAEVSDQYIVDLNNRLQELKDRQSELQAAGVGLGYAEYDDIIAQISAIEQELREYKGDLQDTGNEEENTGSKGTSAFSKIGAAISKITGTVKSFLKNLTKLPGMFSRSSSSSDSMTGSLGKGVKMLLKYGLGIRSVYVLFNKVRSAITTGFQNLAQYSDDTNTALSNLKSALTQLKNSLAAAFSPILEYIEPALTKLINLCSSAANAFARLTASLTGKSTYVKAAKVQEDYAASFSDTASAANDATGALASFDDIEVLTSNDESSSGSSGDADVSDMFTTEEIEPISFDSWGEAFSAFLDYLLDEGVPALENALTGMAGWINNFSANLYEMFTFPGVLEKVILLGQEIAEAFNNFVNLIDWSTLGGALGAGLNLALQFMVSLIYTFDWTNLGAKLAEMVNGAVAEIDFTAVGQWLWSSFKIGLETFAGFFNNLNMPELAQAASNIAIGFFDSITETFQNIDWNTMGSQIAEFLANVDYAAIAESVFTALGAAFSAAAEFLEGLLQGIGNVIANITTWIDEHVFQPFMEGFQSIFGINSPSTVMEEMGTYLMQGLFNGISNMVSNVVTLFETIKTAITGVWTKIKTATTNTWTGIKNTIKSAINGIIGSINGLIGGAVEGINAMITALNSLSFDIPDWVPVVGGNSLGFGISTITAPQIPYLAQGAVIQGANPFLAVLGDQRSGQTNIETPLATMIDAFNMAMDARGDGRDQTLQVNFYVEGKKFAQATLDNFIDEANRRGGIDIDLVGGTA